MSTKDETRYPLRVLAPLRPAWRRMVRVCFGPFNIETWFLLGLCAFMTTAQTLAFQSGSAAGGGVPRIDPDTTIEALLDRGVDWLASHLAWVVGVSSVLALFWFVIFAVLTWVSSRGKFMLVHGIVRDRVEIGDSWKMYARAGNEVFLFRLVTFATMTLITVGMLGGSAWYAWPWYYGNEPSLPALQALLVSTLILTPLAVLYFHSELIINDFVVPRMIASKQGVLAAWGATFRDVIYGHFWKFVLFYCVRSVLWVAQGLLIGLVACVTCCLVMMPYIGSVILLPITVFDWCYGLYFVRQLSSGWNVFPFTGDNLRTCTKSPVPADRPV